MASLSDTPRRLGSESGRIRRAARDIERGGGNPTRFLEEASKVKLGERGITSAESNAEEQRLGERLERGLLETRRRSLMDGTRPNTVSGAENLITPGTGTFNPGGRTPVKPAATPPAATPPAATPPAATPPAATPPAATPPAATPATKSPPVVQRPSLIDGKPAGDVLNPMRDRVATLQSGQPFDPSISAKNLETKGLDGAVADYQRRVALQDNPEPQAPGNKPELIASLGIPGVSEIAGLAGRKTTPLQDALDAARARRTAAEPMIPDAAPSIAPKPMTVGGVEVRDPSYGLPRGPSPRSAATPGLVTPPDAASVAPVAPAPSRPVATFQPMDESQSESALLNRRKQAEMAAARKKIGDRATAPEGFENTGVGSLLKFLSRPRL